MKLQHITTSIIAATLLMMSANASEDQDIGNQTKSYSQIKSINELEPTIKFKAPEVIYQVEADFSKSIATLPTYRVKNIQNHSQKIAKIFNFQAVKQNQNSVKDGLSSTLRTDKEGRTIEYFNSGAVFFSNKSLILEESEDILGANKLTQKSAKKHYQELATNFLTKHNLLRTDSHFSHVSFAKVQKLGKDDVYNLQQGIKPTQKEKVVGVAVHFNYTIEGIPTWGAGSETTVYFDKNGISGYFDQVPTLSLNKSKGQRKLISSSEAINRYTSNKQVQNLLRAKPIVVENAIIRNVQLVYHIEAVNKIQKEVKPYYLISGTMIGKDFNGEEQKTKFKWLESAEG